MKSFIKAFKEYMAVATLEGTSPILFYLDGKYHVTWFYSVSTIKRLGGEIIL